MKPPEKILVIRNDKLGDFMLTFPSFALLKPAFPECRIYALVPQYTREMAELCPGIDEIIVDQPRDSSKLIETIKAQKFDAAITLFSTTRIGWVLFRAGIRYRLAPATKIAQIFYNHRLTQRRSQSAKPEYEYNLDLIRYFINQHQATAREPEAPYLAFNPKEQHDLRKKFCQNRQIEETTKIVFLHSGSGGSANNLSVQQYAKLITLLAAKKLHVVLTVGPGELPCAQQLANLLKDIPHSIYESKDGLAQFARHIDMCDMFISGSTGPLHMAGVLNKNTAAFYPKKRSATPLRWQTCNDENKRLFYTPTDTAEDCDMSTVDLELAAKQIRERFL